MKRGRRAESFPPKRNFINEGDKKKGGGGGGGGGGVVLYSACLEGFYSQPLIQNTKKKPKAKAITGDKTGRKPKSDKGKSKSQKVG